MPLIPCTTYKIRKSRNYCMTIKKNFLSDGSRRSGCFIYLIVSSNFLTIVKRIACRQQEIHTLCRVIRLFIKSVIIRVKPRDTSQHTFPKRISHRQPYIPMVITQPCLQTIIITLPTIRIGARIATKAIVVMPSHVKVA